MPGFAKLDDRDFIRAFQVTVGHQNNQLDHACLGGFDRIRCCHYDPGVYRTHGIERWMTAIGLFI